ncbi:sigma-like protein [Streptomyces echinatus]|uniref:sigma-like protein n=1 Tax=Streptomyces echinatus TaxID=67293 RepID=UPI0037873974
MSSTEKQTTEVTTMENHAPVPPALSEPRKQDAQTPTPSSDEKITTLENHAPVPPALDLDGK